MAAAISPEMFATDIALEQSAAGVPFREAYRLAKEQLDGIERPDASESLAKRVSPGACGQLLLDRISARLDSEIKGLDAP